MKKLFSLLFVLTLILSICPMALADDASHAERDCPYPDDPCTCGLASAAGGSTAADPYFYYPVSLAQTRDSLNLREKVIHIQLRPELGEDNRLHYSSSDDIDAQLVDKMSGLQTQGNGELSGASAVLQFDLNYSNPAHKLSEPGEESEQSSGLNITMPFPEKLRQEGAAFRTRINVQDKFTIEASDAGALSGGFSLSLDVTDDGCSFELKDSAGNSPGDLILSSGEDFSDWKLTDGKWQSMPVNGLASMSGGKWLLSEESGSVSYAMLRDTENAYCLSASGWGGSSEERGAAFAEFAGEDSSYSIAAGILEQKMKENGQSAGSIGQM